MVLSRRGRWVVVVVLIAAAFVGGRVTTSGSSVTTPTFTPLTASDAGFYLVLGGSSSLGIQPDGVPSDNAERTTTGYADDVVKLENGQLHEELQLEQIGCLGTRVEYLTVDPTSNGCYKEPSSQLTTAVAYLKSHRKDKGIVSIDLGFNDIRFCLWEHPVNAKCVPAGLVGVVAGFPTVLKDLKAAAGPGVAIVGLTYYDPFLAFYLHPSDGPTVANQSLAYITQLNAILAKDYTAAGIPYANGASIFDSQDSSPVALPNVGTVPANVKAICTDTWMCVGAPFGPDDHPNNAGYWLIARGLVAALPAPWRIPVVK